MLYWKKMLSTEADDTAKKAFLWANVASWYQVTPSDKTDFTLSILTHVTLLHYSNFEVCYVINTLKLSSHIIAFYTNVDQYTDIMMSFFG